MQKRLYIALTGCRLLYVNKNRSRNIFRMFDNIKCNYKQIKKLGCVSNKKRKIFGKLLWYKKTKHFRMCCYRKPINLRTETETLLHTRLHPTTLSLIISCNSMSPCVLFLSYNISSHINMLSVFIQVFTT